MKNDTLINVFTKPDDIGELRFSSEPEQLSFCETVRKSSLIFIGILSVGSIRRMKYQF